MPNSRHSAKKDVAEHRYAGQPMPSAAFLPRVWHSAKKSFTECNSLPSATLGKEGLCRVPVFNTWQRILHSAKSLFPVAADSGPTRRTRDAAHAQTTAAQSRGFGTLGCRACHFFEAWKSWRRIKWHQHARDGFVVPCWPLDPGDPRVRLLQSLYDC